MMDAKYVLFLLFFLLLAGCSTQNSSLPAPLPGANSLPTTAQPTLPIQSAVFHPSNVTLMLEVAQTNAQLARGLMYRTTLAPNAGMLFLLPKEENQSFWMAHTLIPLDLLYLDSNWRVVDIELMSPCLESNLARCPSYPSSRPAHYAIELNENFSRSHGLQVGETVEINLSN